MKSLSTYTVLLLVFLYPLQAIRAGTVNIDLQWPSATTASAKGALGTGTTWNDVTANKSNLVDDQGNPTQTDITFVDFSGGSDTTLTGNHVQIDYAYKSGAGDPMLEFTISDLRAGEDYKLVLYNPYDDRPQGIVVNGTNAGTFNGVAGGSPLPGVKGLDYVLVHVTADAGGDINVLFDGLGGGLSTGCAGVQIQGWLLGEARPWKADVQVSEKAAMGYRGDDVYATRPNARQRVSTRSRRGRCYFRIENDGSAFEDFVVEGDGSDREASRKYFSIGPRKNITSMVRRGAYTNELCAGESLRILAKVTAKRRARGTFDTHVQAESDRDSFQRTGDLCTHRLRL